MFPLPPTCKVNLDDGVVSTVNIGRCKNVPCASKLPTISDTLCCMPGNTRMLQVSCEGFSYEIKQTLSCACADCVYNKKVSVSGRVNNVDVAVTDAYVLYDDVTYPIADSQFFFEATPMGGHVIFQVKSSAFMSQLVTLDSIEGVTQMYVEVSLVAKPDPSVVDVALGAELEVETPGLPSAVTVIIPKDSFQDKNGDQVSGNVNVFLSFSDPRKSDGLDAAPGQFTFQNSDGETQPLKTFGVLTMEAEDENGNEIFLVGKMTLEVDADALGIELGQSVLLWNIDPVSGQWQKSGELTRPGSRRRRRRQTTTINVLSGQTEIKQNFPYINFDQPIDLEQICYLAVYVYYGGDFSKPLPGERLTAIMIDVNRQPIGQTRATTDQNGRACLVILCGFKHTVHLLSSAGVVVHPTHYLSTFPYVNTPNGFEFTADQEDNVNGPLYRWRAADGNRCLVSDTSTYHFKLSVPPIRPNLHGSLHAGNSWFPPPPAKWQACALLLLINVRMTGTRLTFSLYMKHYHCKAFVQCDK